MSPLSLFRFPAPAQNPLGFGGTDWIELGLALLLTAILLLRGRLISLAGRLAARPAWSTGAIAALPILLRIALLGRYPVPTPRVADDFSYLLLGDTLAHFRLANATHPLYRFFEAVFVVQTPAYASIFPPGQGLVLAFGEVLFRSPWVGVAISTGAFCGLCYWMLRAWIAPHWALLGGLLAVVEFGPLSPWMNTYWGGAVSGIAGCLVFGALPRLRESRRTRDAVLLGAGLALQLLTRPFEFVFLVAIVLLFLVPLRSLATACLVLLPALGLTVLQNKQVTGSWVTLPYQLSRYQYGIPAAFTVQRNPVPHRPLTVEQQIDYDAQVEVHGAGTDTWGTWFARLGQRVRFYRFFFLAPLYLALPVLVPVLRQRRFLWVGGALALFWLGEAFYPYFYPHYIAAIACLFLLLSVKALETLATWRIRTFPTGQDAVALILILCLAHFMLWYGVHLTGNQNLLTAATAEESWDALAYGDPEGRATINARLAAEPGRQLVFVHYWPQHGPHEWIRNTSDIDLARVVWALDRGPEENEVLRRYYPARKAWLLEPDARPPRLAPYSSR